MQILVIFGTRPEAIKLAPVIMALRRQPQAKVSVCVTAQHRGMLDQVLDAFQIEPDYDLNIMSAGQTLFQSTSRIIAQLEPVLTGSRFDCTVVQGDTTTTFCGALASFYARVPVAHVEAGLRTGDVSQPFPEELNRVLTSRVAALHFAPTSTAANNLLREGIGPEHILVTGNTSIDAVRYVASGLEQGTIKSAALPALTAGKKLIVVTAHRRENFGEPLDNIAAAVSRIARRTDVQVVWPVHPNPAVRESVRSMIGPASDVQLIEPLSYVPFVDLMSRSYLLLTDSGGIQEEAPALGKPVLVMRNKTERPEGVEAGAARLVGSDPDFIVSQTERLLDDQADYRRMSSAQNPYGTGDTGERIATAIKSFIESSRVPVYH